MDMLLMMPQIFVFNKKIMNFNYAKETTIMKKTQSTRTRGPRACLFLSHSLSLCVCVTLCVVRVCAALFARMCVCVCVCVHKTLNK